MAIKNRGSKTVNRLNVRGSPTTAMMRTVFIAALVAAAAAIPMQQSDSKKEPKLHRISLQKLAQTPRQVPPLQPCKQDPKA